MSTADEMIAYHESMAEKARQQKAAEVALAETRRAQGSTTTTGTAAAGGGDQTRERPDYGRRIDWAALKREGGPQAVQAALREMWNSGPDERYVSGGDHARGGKMPGRIEKYMRP